MIISFKIQNKTSTNAYADRFIISSAGYVGIGTAATYRLSIGPGVGTTGGSTIRWFNVNTALTYTIFGSAPATGISLYVEGTMWIWGTVAASSDRRIKEDIQDINDDSALNMILAIEPKTYKYIDKINKGYNKVYGFIAQQIREVIPDATSLQKSYIPNIMLLADYDNNFITLPSQPTKIIIKRNDKIK